MSEPFLPFVRPLVSEATRRGVDEVLASGWITTGPQVAAFESELSDYLGGRPTLTYSHATGVMEETLRALGIGPGDEVILPDMTFASGVNVILRVGATPVPVDVDLHTRNMDAACVEAALTERTRGVMPVHFAGLPVDLDPLYALCDQHGVRVIEDAAHAIGARYKGQLVGSFGDVACFSFHANKNLTTIEGAAVASADEALMENLRLRRFHGQEKLEDGSYDIVLAANKYNLSDVAARIGRDQLEALEDRNAKRRHLANRYFETLENFEPVRLPARGDGGHAWHMFAVRIDFEHIGTDRKAFRAAMAERGIGTGMHYPPIHRLSVCRSLGLREAAFPNASRIGRETITLPLFAEMRKDDVERVARALREVLDG
jgi:dTDP-4-amino-4,6-dideoxygalactose transaminase